MPYNRAAKLRIFWLMLGLLIGANGASMEDWWSYDGFSGPDFWGLVNPEWRMCSQGRHQSPVDVNPAQLLFDPNLQQLAVDKATLDAAVTNTGQQLVVSFADAKASSYGVNVSGGPLGAYHYQLHHLLLHFARNQPKGSEHTIDGERFSAELQFLGFNRDLYKNFSEAMTKPEGLVGIAVVVDTLQSRDAETDETGFNTELNKITNAIKQVQYKGETAMISSFSAFHLLPDTDHFITYDGSLTYPGCYETVTWIILNKAVYVSKAQLKVWQNSLHRTESPEMNPSWMGDNFRPAKELNQRLLRTNINFKTRSGKACPTVYKDMSYKSNTFRKSNKLKQLTKQGILKNSSLVEG